MIVTVTVILVLILVGPEDASMALTCCSTQPLETFFLDEKRVLKRLLSEKKVPDQIVTET